MKLQFITKEPALHSLPLALLAELPHSPHSPIHQSLKQFINLISFSHAKCLLKFPRETGFGSFLEMKDFPSCFGENGVQVADSSSSNSGKNAQNLVTCIYQCRIRGRNCLITVTWTKNLMGQSVTVGVV